MHSIDLEEQYEAFHGTLRRMEELVSQLQLWSDECTINHKKEEVRLPQYVEIHLSLEEVKKELEDFIQEHRENKEIAERLLKDEKRMAEKLAEYKETEEVIHAWIREIKNIHVLIAKSNILQAHCAFVEAIYRGER